MRKAYWPYKYLTFLSMLYMTIKVTTALLIYKIISVGHFSASASTFIIPLWFFIGDLIAEVYGYKVSRHLIWMAIFCQFIFAFTCASMIQLPSPALWAHQDAYVQIFSKLPRVAFASFLGIACGAFINVYALTKWKILLKGKYFWLRTFGAATMGELVFTVVVYLTEFLGVVPLAQLIELMAISYLTKVIVNVLLVIPSNFSARLLKKLEGVDTYDYHTNFNPFKFSLE